MAAASCRIVQIQVPALLGAQSISPSSRRCTCDQGLACHGSLTVISGSSLLSSRTSSACTLASVPRTTPFSPLLSVPSSAAACRRPSAVRASSEPLSSSSDSQAAAAAASPPSGPTVADKLQQQLPTAAYSGSVNIPLIPKRSRPLSSTISVATATPAQKRNLQRAAYMSQVAKRNDSKLFVSLALLLLVPPAAILTIAFYSGYLPVLF